MPIYNTGITPHRKKIMTLEYVGPRPIISEHGIGFDKNEPDKYLFLHAVIELLEAIEECIPDKGCKRSDDGTIDLREWKGIDFSHGELGVLIKKHCHDVDTLIEEKDKKSNKTLLDLRKKIQQNTHLTADEKEAWLGNIIIMHDYYIQFIENDFIYEYMIKILAEEIHKRDIKEIRFSLHRNYGYVMSHLHDLSVLSYKLYFKSKLTIETYDNQIMGRLIIE